MDITHRFAQQAFDAFNRLDFDIDLAAALITGSGPVIKVKAFRLAARIIRCLALDYDYGNFGDHDDHTRVVIMAKKITDSVVLDDAP
jgi:hypothetical protein